MTNKIEHHCITAILRTTHSNKRLSGSLEIDALPDRMASKVCVSDSGCWEWQGAKDRAGYGRFGDGRRHGTNITHRLAYMFVYGPIPEGKELDHLCRNRGCCNPDHLEPVTHRVNLQRGVQGAVTHCKWGHELSGDNLKLARRKNGDLFRQCRPCLLRRAREQNLRGRRPAKGGANHQHP